MLQKTPLTVEEALCWCSEENAVVSFSDHYGHPRVVVSCAGYPWLAERDTFLEAVAAARPALVERRQAARPAFVSRAAAGRY